MADNTLNQNSGTTDPNRKNLRNDKKLIKMSNDKFEIQNATSCGMRRSCTTRPKTTGNVKYLRKIGYYDEAKSHFPDQTWCNAIQDTWAVSASLPRSKIYAGRFFFVRLFESSRWCIRWVLHYISYWLTVITKVWFRIMVIPHLPQVLYGVFVFRT